MAKTMRHGWLVLLITVMLMGRVHAQDDGQIFVVDGREVIRTPDERFENLPDYPFEPNVVEVNGLRMHYLDEGEADAPVVWLQHGQPSWSYDFRGVIPPLVEAGYRVIAPDLIGFGRSDKLVNEADYSYALHVEQLNGLLEALDLRGVTFVGHDWGGIVGLSVVAQNPDRFDRVVAANTTLPGLQLLNTDLGEPTPGMLEQLAVWEAGFGASGVTLETLFPTWQQYAATMTDVGQVMQVATIETLPDDVVAAYNAPFPDERYLAGARVFPRLLPSQPLDPAFIIMQGSWGVLETWDKPFLTIYSDSDPLLTLHHRLFTQNIPGAQGQPHHIIEGASHFLQEEAPDEFATVLIDWLE